MIDMEQNHTMSIRCYYENGSNYTQHYQDLEIDEIPKWIKAYWFTHPNLEAITIKLWTREKE